MKNYILLTALLLFFTSCGDDKDVNKTLTDQDGNRYNTVVIGNQTWMKENLRTTTFNDGTSIPTEPNSASWFNLTTAAYCWYDNDSEYEENGAFYNAYAANSGKICPQGWHVPTDDEFRELEMFIGMDEATSWQEGWRGTDEAKKLKTVAGWGDAFPGTDEFGFSAIPTGIRQNWEDFPDFTGINRVTIFWASSSLSTPAARQLDAEGDDIGRFVHSSSFTTAGYCVRCVKD